MKVAQCSDMHIEFGDYQFDRTVEADVLILGGDILLSYNFEPYNKIIEGTKSDRFHKFLEQASAQFKDVIYIMGNHEHYHGDFAKSESNIRECMSRYPNIHFLEKESITIGDVTFVGGTMWTNMNNSDHLTLLHVQHRMNDFQIVKNSSKKYQRRVPIYKKEENGIDYVKDERGLSVQDGWKYVEEDSTFSPQDAADDFDKFFGYLENVVEGKHDQKFFVCTHHSPSKLSTKPQYKHEYLMNGAYSSSLEEWIMDHPQIKVWTHGHTHDAFDYMVGDTRIVCNPRGYIGHEQRANDFRMVIIEV